jgi:hypothetical protein
MTTRREASLLLLNRDLESKLASLREGALLTDAALKAGDKFSAGLLASGLVARILEVTAPEPTPAERYDAWEAENACPTCHLVGGHDEDMHAEADIDRRDNCAWAVTR